MLVGGGQRCIRRQWASELAPEAIRRAVGGGCQSGWGRLLSVTNAIEAGTWRQGDVASEMRGAAHCPSDRPLGNAPCTGTPRVGGKGCVGVGAVRAPSPEGPPRRNSGLCHVCTGGNQHKSTERKWAHQWPIRPSVPFCHRTWDTKMPVNGPQIDAKQWMCSGTPMANAKLYTPDL